MKVRMGFTLVLMVLAGASAQNKSYNGYWWADETPDFKIGFAHGFAIAMTHNSDIASFNCVAAKHGGTIPEKFPGSDELDACLKTPEVMALSFGSIRMGQLAEGVDEFYKDFRNKGIEVTDAMYYVRDQLRGKSDAELAAELASWRQAANK
jgi:hypothetical protein